MTWAKPKLLCFCTVLAQFFRESMSFIHLVLWEIPALKQQEKRWFLCGSVLRTAKPCSIPRHGSATCGVSNPISWVIFFVVEKVGLRSWCSKCRRRFWYQSSVPEPCWVLVGTPAERAWQRSDSELFLKSKRFTVVGNKAAFYLLVLFVANWIEKKSLRFQRLSGYTSLPQNTLL